MGRSDDMAKAFRGELGLDNEEGFDGVTLAQDGPEPEVSSSGFQLGDLDRLLREHERESYWRGRYEGEARMAAQLEQKHSVEIGQYVGAAFGLVESDVLSAIVVAAVKARDDRRKTRGEIVQAVIDAVKREGASLGEMAHRARTGELFS